MRTSPARCPVTNKTRLSLLCLTDPGRQYAALLLPLLNREQRYRRAHAGARLRVQSAEPVDRVTLAALLLTDGRQPLLRPGCERPGAHADTLGAPISVVYPLYADGRYTSMDRRLSSFGAITYGAKLTRQFGENWTADVKFKQYEQKGRWAQRSRWHGSGIHRHGQRAR